MRPALLPVVLLAAVACSRSTSHPASAPAPSGQATPAARPRPADASATAPAPATAPAVRLDAAQGECVDRWLKGHGLDTYGNPEGTMYAGGSPTFDERTGKTVDRWSLVARNRPEALQSCAVPLPP